MKIVWRLLFLSLVIGCVSGWEDRYPAGPHKPSSAGSTPAPVTTEPLRLPRTAQQRTKETLETRNAQGGGGGAVCPYECRVRQFDEYWLPFRWNHQDYPDVEYPVDIEFMSHCEGLPDGTSDFLDWTLTDGIYSGDIPVPSDVFCNITLRAYWQGYISDNSNSKRRYMPRNYGVECWMPGE